MLPWHLWWVDVDHVETGPGAGGHGDVRGRPGAPTITGGKLIDQPAGAAA